MVISRNRMEDMKLPEIPGSNARSSEKTIISSEQFTRKKLRGILHLITGELKNRGTKIPHIFLPFRSRIDDSKLELFICKIFPCGELVGMFDETEVIEILRKFDEFTLICGLKYLWSRLPNNEIIGWDVYLEYKRKEKEAGYPKGAFLSIMPKCLSSPAHASIVYDFLDLLISIASNSQYNYLSGRKIAKMSSLWAFNGSTKPHQSPFYDATLNKENTFIDGLDYWKPSSEALFHLLLSFLRAMLPDNETDTLKLPKTLQSLLITNSYPPLENTDSIKSIITIPCVVIKSTKISSNVYELLSKVRNTISFSKKDSFLSMENYTILKNIFQKSSTNEIVSSLTEESRRILTRLDTDPIQSDYDLYPGWARLDVETDPNIPLFSQINIEDVSLQDYYIWTWLSSLASDQTQHNKKLFGRSIVVEASLKGFQKWLIITEQVLDSEEYIKHFKGPSQGNNKRVLSNESYKNLPLPPPPPPAKDTNDLLPKYRFNDDFKIEVIADDDEYIYPTEVNDEELSDYRKYLESLSERHDNELANIFKQKTSLSSIDKKSTHRPPPPPLDSNESSPKDHQYQQASYTPHLLHYGSPSHRYQSHIDETEHNNMTQTELIPISDQNKLDVNPGNGSKKLSTSSGLSSSFSQYMTPEGSNSPRKANTASLYYSPNNFSPEHTTTPQFKEPYDNYETETEKYARLKNNKSDEPFDNYYVEKFNSRKLEYEEAPKPIKHDATPRPVNHNVPPRPVNHDIPPILVNSNTPTSQNKTEVTTRSINNGDPHASAYTGAQQNDDGTPNKTVNHDLPPVPQQMGFQDLPMNDDNNEQYRIENDYIPSVLDKDQLQEQFTRSPDIDDTTKEEKKKKKRRHKKKDHESPNQDNSEKLDSFQPSPSKILPPGPAPPPGTILPGQLPPPAPPTPRGMVPPFIDSTSPGIPPFFPPGPPPGMDEEPNVSLDQKKKKEKVRRKKKTEAQSLENKRIDPNMTVETAGRFNVTEAIQSHINAVEQYDDSSYQQYTHPLENNFSREPPDPTSQNQADENTPRRMTPPRNSWEPILNQRVPSQHVSRQDVPPHQPHITRNNGEKVSHEIRSPPQPQQYYQHRQTHSQQRPPNSPHGSHSVPHIMTPPVSHPGTQSAPHLPIPADHISQTPGQIPYMRTPKPYQNGSAHNHQLSPQQVYAQYAPKHPPQMATQHQPYQPAINNYQPPPNNQYYQPHPHYDPTMGHYQPPPPMNQQHYQSPVPQQYYPRPPQVTASPRMNARPYGNPASNNLPMMNVPAGVKHKKNGRSNKADLRAAFNQGTFGI